MLRGKVEKNVRVKRTQQLNPRREKKIIFIAGRERERKENIEIYLLIVCEKRRRGLESIACSFQTDPRTTGLSSPHHGDAASHISAAVKTGP